jgi:RecB family exonuclease
MKTAISISEKLLNKIKTEKRADQRNISFSQFSVYESCPYRWYLTYAKGNYLFSGSIHTVFGTAIHEAVQQYLTLLFNDSVKASEEFDMIELFERRFKEEYIKELESNNGVHFSSKQEMQEFYEDGIEILKYIKKKRKILFDHNDYELLGMEIPINTEIKDGTDTFIFNGYIDMVYRDKREGTVYIEDFKTSTKGWSKYEKSDDTKQSQILLYKNYFAKQFGVDPEKIIPKFRILKRKLWEDSAFPQSRVQIHEPANGKAKVHQAVQRLVNFIDECYSSDGSPKDKPYLKKASVNNCRFCPFSDKPELCNKKV